MPRRKEPRIPDALLDQLLAGADAKTAFDPDGLLDDLKKALAERVLNAEMDHHLEHFCVRWDRIRHWRDNSGTRWAEPGRGAGRRFAIEPLWCARPPCAVAL